MSFYRSLLRITAATLTTMIIAGCSAAEPTPAQPTLTPLPATNPPTSTPEQPTSTPSPLPPAFWEDATDITIGKTEEWTNKVELADINGDGLVDILFANGGNYDSPGPPEHSRVFLNQGPGKMFNEVTEDVFGEDGMLARVIKVRDINVDSYPDIIIGTTYETQSRLFLGDDNGHFAEVTQTHLPQLDASIGDLEIGDVDDDGDLDLVLADWGPVSPMKIEAQGGRTMLWLNQGDGQFSDATDRNMPDSLVKFSWELELVDIDNDFDLDILVSCKLCRGSFLFENDGTGVFTDVSEDNLPQYRNNYDFEAMDLNGDNYLDLVTVNDGANLQENVFLNNQQGGFEDVTADLWPASENLGKDDNMVVFIDFESDGDADILIGSLDGPDRLMINDGSGHLTLEQPVFAGTDTLGTLGLAIADLNGDGRVDVVQGQGETRGAIDERVFFGKDIRPDTAPPVITLVEAVESTAPAGPVQVRARIHDNKSPTMPHDWQSVVLRWTDDDQTLERPMVWYGEYLWRATIDEPPIDDFTFQVCATDAAGNEACSAP